MHYIVPRILRKEKQINKLADIQIEDNTKLQKKTVCHKREMIWNDDNNAIHGQVKIVTLFLQ